jgi:LacI family transcriptional regulator
MVVADDFGAQAGYRAMGTLLRQGRPDALLCANDLLAFGALRCLAEAGLRVPEDVRVVGMDDTELAALSTPSLSSVSLGAMERGMLAGRLLLERLAQPDLPPRRRTVPPQLMVRESSAGPDA